MRRIAIINQKGGVGKTTTAVNLGAALARLGRRVLVIDMDPQANASTNLAVDLHPGEPSTYSVLLGKDRVADALHTTATENLWVLPAHLDLSGAELELASAIGRETILKDALDDWVRERTAEDGEAPVDYVLLDNPPSLGLLSVNGLTAADEVLIAVQTEFFALQGLSKLVEVVQLLQRRMNPALEITGVLACLYDSRLRLAREVLAELRTHFPTQCLRQTIRQNVKLAECPSFAQTIFEYAPDSKGALDHLAAAAEVIEQETPNHDIRERSPESTVDELREVDVPRPPDPVVEPQSIPESETRSRPVEGQPQESIQESPQDQLQISPAVAVAPEAQAEPSSSQGTTVALLDAEVTVEIQPAAEVEVPAAVEVEATVDTTVEAKVAAEDQQPQVDAREQAQPVALPESAPLPEPADLPAHSFEHYLGEDHVRLPGRQGPWPS